MDHFQKYLDQYEQVQKELLRSLTLEEYMVLTLPAALDCDTQYIFGTILVRELKTKKEVDIDGDDQWASFDEVCGDDDEVCGDDISTLSQNRKDEIMEFLVGHIDTFDVEMKGDWYHLYMKTNQERLADHQKLVDKIKPFIFKLIELNYECLYDASKFPEINLVAIEEKFEKLAWNFGKNATISI